MRVSFHALLSIACRRSCVRKRYVRAAAVARGRRILLFRTVARGRLTVARGRGTSLVIIRGHGPRIGGDTKLSLRAVRKHLQNAKRRHLKLGSLLATGKKRLQNGLGRQLGYA